MAEPTTTTDSTTTEQTPQTPEKVLEDLITTLKIDIANLQMENARLAVGISTRDVEISRLKAIIDVNSQPQSQTENVDLSSIDNLAELLMNS